MEIKFIDFVLEYGLEPVILALAINIVTGLVKLPLKALARKSHDSAAYTRFLVFLPILTGLCLTTLYFMILNRRVEINNRFVSLWLSSASLSLSFYAVFEKLIPSKNKIVKDEELKWCRQILSKILKATKDGEKIGEYANDVDCSVEAEKVSVCGGKENVEHKKIFLRGNFDENADEVDVKE